MEEPTTGAPVFPPGRYGRRREPPGLRRWVGPVVLCLLVAAVLAGAGAVYVRTLTRQVNTQVISFFPRADAVRIVFDVNVPHGRPAVCTVRSRNEAGQEVGRADVRVPRAPAGRSTVRVTYTLATRGRPATGEVAGCQQSAG